MQTATSETESTLLDLSICVHHYTLRAPCPKGQGTVVLESPGALGRATEMDQTPPNLIHDWSNDAGGSFCGTDPRPDWINSS